MSIRSRAHKWLCARYRSLLNRRSVPSPKLHRRGHGRPLFLEALEPRVLLSADFVLGRMDAPDPGISDCSETQVICIQEPTPGLARVVNT